MDAAEPPSRVFLGRAGPAWVPRLYEERMKTWKEWESISNADGLGEAFPS